MFSNLIKVIDPEIDPLKACRDLNSGLFKPSLAELTNSKCPLYISGFKVATDSALLKQHSITHILTAMPEIVSQMVRQANPELKEYLLIPVDDSPSSRLLPFLHQALPFLRRNLTEGICSQAKLAEGADSKSGSGFGAGSGGSSKAVLIHDETGLSRTLPILIAYLMKYTGQGLEQAIEVVKEAYEASLPEPQNQPGESTRRGKQKFILREKYLEELKTYEQELIKEGKINNGNSRFGSIVSNN